MAWTRKSDDQLVAEFEAKWAVAGPVERGRLHDRRMAVLGKRRARAALEKTRKERIRKYNTQKAEDEARHKTKIRSIEQAKRQAVRASRRPALPVGLMEAPVEIGMSPSVYMLGMWACARATSNRPGVTRYEDGTVAVWIGAFDLVQDFWIESGREVSFLKRAIRKAKDQWRYHQLTLPGGVRAPLVESMELKLRAGDYWIEFKLHPAISDMLFARDEEHHRVWPRRRYTTADVPRFGALSDARLYFLCCARNWGHYRHWTMSPEALKVALSLRPDERPTHVETVITRASERFPMSRHLRLQWSPRQVGTEIVKYEFQIVPLSSDIRAWFSHREPIHVKEDGAIKGLVRSITMQIARYRRNSARVRDREEYFRFFIGNPMVTPSDRKRFEGMLAILPDIVPGESKSSFAKLWTIEQAAELDRPRAPDECYVPNVSARFEGWDDYAPDHLWDKPLIVSPGINRAPAEPKYAPAGGKLTPVTHLPPRPGVDWPEDQATEEPQIWFDIVKVTPNGNVPTGRGYLAPYVD